MVPNSAFVIDGLKPIQVTGVPVVYADRPGRNRNVYSKNTLSEAIDYYSRLCQLDGTYKYAFAKHPKDENEEWMGLIAGTVDKLYFGDDGTTVQGDFTLLPTIWGHFVSWLLKNDYPIGTSVRGSAQGKKGKVEFGGKTLDVTHRTSLKLEGVDFVIYPSFITTHANKGKVQEQYRGEFRDSETDETSYDRILESFYNDTASETGLHVEEIKKLLKQDGSTDREGHDMDELALKREKAQIDIDRAELENKRLENEKMELQKTIESLTKEQATLAESVKEMHAMLESQHRVNDALKGDIAKTEETLSKVTADLKNAETLLETAKVEQTKIEEKTVSAEKGHNVRFAGKFFDSSNPPKLRIVPVEEKVFEDDYSKAHRKAGGETLRKLVALSGDGALAKEVFGVVDASDEQSIDSFKLPVYFPMKSETEGYDVDLVLSTKNLAATTNTFYGKTGQTFSQEARDNLSSFLRAKYQSLQDAGYSEMPKPLQSMDENRGIAEKVIGDADGIVADFLRHAILTGTIVVPQDKITESVTFDEDKVKSAIAAALIPTPVQEEEIVQESTTSEEGGATEEAVTAPETTATETAVQEQTTSGSIDRTLGETAPAEETIDETVPPAETGTTENEAGETNEEDEMANGDLIQKLRDMLESRLEGIQIADDSQVIEIIETLIEDYAKIYNDLEGLTLANARQAKLNEMRSSGVDESVLKEELDKAESIEDIEAIAERVLKLTKSIKESSSRETRRSVPIVPAATGSAKEETSEEGQPSEKIISFDKVMRAV
jgi:hypothetical protein